MQHLAGDLQNPDLQRVPVWGTIGWVWARDLTLTHFISGIITAGPDASSVRPIPVPNGRILHDQLDHVTLSVKHDKEVNLSEAMRLVVRIARSLEASIGPQFAELPVLAPVDTILLFEIEIPSRQPDSESR